MTLVQALVQLGPEITAEPEVTRGILARFDITEANPPNDEQVVDIITQLARLATEGPVPCDVRSLVLTLSSLVSRHSIADQYMR